MHLKVLLDFSLICHIERMDHSFMLHLIGDDCKNDGGQFVFQPQHGSVLLLKSLWLVHYTTPFHNQRLQIGCVLNVHQQTLT